MSFYSGIIAIFRKWCDFNQFFVKSIFLNPGREHSLHYEQHKSYLINEKIVMNKAVYQFLDGVSFKLSFHNKEKSLFCQIIYQQTVYLKGARAKLHCVLDQCHLCYLKSKFRIFSQSGVVLFSLLFSELLIWLMYVCSFLPY